MKNSKSKLSALEIAKRNANLINNIESAPEYSQSHLSPKRHQTPDFFTVDLFDATLKDDLGSMEYPLFALRAGDCRTRHYELNGNSIEINPNQNGCATIYDKDIWIYCISALMAAKNRGEQISRTVRFTAYDFLVSTNKSCQGRQYKLLKQALFRLAGTRIITNIVTGNYRLESNFGLLDKVDIIYKDPTDENSPMIAISVTLPDWLYRSITSSKVKTISPDYFRIRKALDRRIYELCAKHCGSQAHWQISLPLLHKKTGSTTPLRNFRVAVRSLVDSNELPDYKLEYDSARDVLMVFNRNKKSVLSVANKIKKLGKI